MQERGKEKEKKYLEEKKEGGEGEKSPCPNYPHACFTVVLHSGSHGLISPLPAKNTGRHHEREGKLSTIPEERKREDQICLRSNCTKCNSGGSKRVLRRKRRRNSGTRKKEEEGGRGMKNDAALQCTSSRFVSDTLKRFEGGVRASELVWRGGWAVMN